MKANTQHPFLLVEPCLCITISPTNTTPITSIVTITTITNTFPLGPFLFLGLFLYLLPASLPFPLSLLTSSKNGIRELLNIGQSSLRWLRPIEAMTAQLPIITRDLNSWWQRRQTLGKISNVEVCSFVTGLRGILWVSGRNTGTKQRLGCHVPTKT